MCYSDFGESRDKWRIVFYRYPIKSGFKRRSRNAFIQGGIKAYSTNIFTFPVSFPHAILSVSVVIQRDMNSASQTTNVYNISNTQMNTVEYNLEAYCLLVGY